MDSSAQRDAFDDSTDLLTKSGQAGNFLAGLGPVCLGFETKH